MKGIPVTAVACLLLATTVSAAGLAGSLDVPGIARSRDVAIFRNGSTVYAFLTTDSNPTGSELNIINITNPASPQLVSSLHVSSGILKVAVQNTRVLWLATRSDDSEVIGVDWSVNPPRILSRYNTPNYPDATALYVQGSTLYVGTNRNFLTAGELYAFNVADPTRITLLSSAKINSKVTGITGDGERVYLSVLSVFDEVQAWSLSAGKLLRSAAVDLVGTVGAQSLTYSNGKLYVVTYNNGNLADVFVLSAGATPKLVASKDTASNNTDVAVAQGLILVAKNSSSSMTSRGLTVLDESLNVIAQSSTETAASAVEALVSGQDVYAVLAGMSATQELQIVKVAKSTPPAHGQQVLRDVNGDGKLIVSCLGDSNTVASGFSDGVKWCERLSQLFNGSATTVNRGVAATTAVIDAANEGPERLRYTLQNDHPDAVILAFGTNDLGYGYSPEQVVAAYESMRKTAADAGVVCLVATTPKRFDTQSQQDPQLNVKIGQLNTLLTTTWTSQNRAGRLIDFHSSMIYPSDYMPDGLHLRTTAHAKRATAAWQKLTATEPAGTPAAASQSTTQTQVQDTSADSPVAAQAATGSDLRAVAATLTKRVRDINGDGVTIACLGDSNTAPVGFSDGVKWCERLASWLPSNYKTVNHGVPGTTAVRIPDSSDAYDQLAAALSTDGADAVIFAFGTNDIGYGYSPADVLAAYQELKQLTEQAGAAFFVATTPLRYDQRSLNTAIKSLNKLVRSQFPKSQVLEFTWSMVYPTDYMPDRLHLRSSGHLKRAAEAYLKTRY